MTPPYACKWGECSENFESMIYLWEHIERHVDNSKPRIVHLLDDDDEDDNEETTVVSAPASSSLNRSAMKSPKIVPSQLDVNVASGSNDTAQSANVRTDVTQVLKNHSQQATIDSVSSLQRQQQQSLIRAQRIQQQRLQMQLLENSQLQHSSLASSQSQHSSFANSQLQHSSLANSQLQQSLTSSQLQQSLVNSQLQQSLVNSQLQQSLANSQLQQSLANSQLQQSFANSILIQPHAGQFPTFNAGMQNLMRSQHPTHSQVITTLIEQNPIYALHYHQQIQSVGAIQPPIQPIGGTRQTNIIVPSSNSNLITENAIITQGPSITSNNRSPISSVNRTSTNSQNQVAEVGGGLRSMNPVGQQSLQASQLVNLPPSVGQKDGKN